MFYPTRPPCPWELCQCCVSGRVDAAATRAWEASGAVLQSAMQLSEAEDLFLDSLIGKSPQTAKTYGTALRRFYEHLEDRGHKVSQLDTTEISETALREFQAWLFRGY